MLSWFKKKLGGAQPLPPEQGAGSDVVTPVAEVSGQQENGASFFLRLKDGLSRTRKTFVRQIDALFLGKKQIDAELLEDLEEILIMADIGANTTQELLEKTREQVRRNELADGRALKTALKEMILGYLRNADRPEDVALPAQGPFVVMVLGVNGVGKTTTIGKLAHKFTQAGQKVLLVAADTFRAAASEQLQIWGKRVGVEVVAQQAGADPSSVVFDALDYAKPRNFDVVLVDTAGRLHTKVNLMEELKKIKRVMDKKIPGAPHEILLVLDATTGQNAISQARLFNEAVDVTGLALTKLDGTAKGGIVINISHEFSIPIRFIGIGEQMEDLRDFEPNEFVEALFAEGEA
ncbi:MAG: signal recognition particle-docking protein FtsY [Proteobacteria bacterium]|nr:signal recognition particle-docking protein FtsY [Pseudomonadota bacterium]MBU1546328.1 signal recognition particle-docking protein FtsY [Pseudomonadota bacterium]MBU2619014.1 signal recognition particle-docking protein FtsY [Pseudomonadota bacterium]